MVLSCPAAAAHSQLAAVTPLLSALGAVPRSRRGPRTKAGQRGDALELLLVRVSEQHLHLVSLQSWMEARSVYGPFSPVLPTEELVQGTSGRTTAPRCRSESD